MSELLTVEEVASACQVHPETVKRAIRTGRLRAAPLGERGAYRLRQEWVDAWIEGRAGELHDRGRSPADPEPRAGERTRGRLVVHEGMGKRA